MGRPNLLKTVADGVRSPKSLPREIWLEEKSPDHFTCGRLIGKFEEGLSGTSVVEEFGINKSVVSCPWKAFQSIGTDVRKVVGGFPRKTTVVNNRYIVLQVVRTLYQSAMAFAQQLCTVTGQEFL
ncbi:transposable element Tcb2 transposase [Trichonephila clavipes]|nr:transposable element Tcb2 transposase [Trichonephila clavipes]